MGVNLHDLVEGKKINFEYLSGKAIAIDAFNMLYQFLASIRQEDGTPLKDFKGRITAHLSGLFYRTAKFISYGIKPIYVFDGEPPKFKKRELEERKERKEEAKFMYEKAEDLGKIEEMRLYSQQFIKLTDEMVEESKKLIEAMGLPYVEGKEEGEAQAAEIVKEGKAYAAGSQDYDTLLFGSPRLVRNLSITGKRKLPRKNEYITIEPEEIELKEMLSHLGISREKLIWIGILIGTDYNEGVKGVGQKTALKLVKQYNSFQELKRFVEHKYSYQFPAEIEEIIEYFKNPPVKEGVKIEFRKPDKEKVIKLLVDEHDFSLERVEKTINKVEEEMEERLSQKKLSEWFS